MIIASMTQRWGVATVLGLVCCATWPAPAVADDEPRRHRRPPVPVDCPGASKALMAPTLCMPREPDAACVRPDAKELASLRLANPGEIEAGDGFRLYVGHVECCTVFNALPACVAWRVEPAAPGVTIDAATGALAVAATAPSGTTFKVVADVDGGRKQIAGQVLVYTRAANPFVGVWSEDLTYECGSNRELPPVDRIREVRFRAGGSMSVTWDPFETYVDHYGTYRFDARRRTLSFDLQGMTAQHSTSGTYALDAAGRLIVRGIWLSSPRAPEVKRCGHRFVRPR